MKIDHSNPELRFEIVWREDPCGFEWDGDTIAGHGFPTYEQARVALARMVEPEREYQAGLYGILDHLAGTVTYVPGAEAGNLPREWQDSPLWLYLSRSTDPEVQR